MSDAQTRFFNLEDYTVNIAPRAVEEDTTPELSDQEREQRGQLVMTELLPRLRRSGGHAA